MGVVALGALGCDSRSDRVPPPVILISLDAVRADALGCYSVEAVPLPGRTPVGSLAATPRIDEFAAKATRFETCVVTSPSRLSNYASMFTGLHPNEHALDGSLRGTGNRGESDAVLAPRFETLAEALAARGYRAGGIVSNGMRAGSGLDAGFESFDVADEPLNDTTDRALAWMQKHMAIGSRPAFLFVSYGVGRAPREEVRNDQHVAALDAEIATLFDTLNERGLFDRALVMVTASGGDDSDAADRSNEGNVELERVPLLIKLPGQNAGDVRRERTSLVHVPGLIATGLAGTDAESARAIFARVPSAVTRDAGQLSDGASELGPR